MDTGNTIIKVIYGIEVSTTMVNLWGMRKNIGVMVNYKKRGITYEKEER